MKQRNQSYKVRAAAFLALLLLCVPLFAPYGSRSAAARLQETEGRFYPETGKTLAPEFLAYYDNHGGVPLFGYPLTEASRIIVDAARAWLDRRPGLISEVRLVGYDEEAAEAFRQALQAG